MLCPFDLEYKRMFDNRLPSKYLKYKTEPFLPSTRLCLQNLFRILLNVESKIEVLRQRLTRLSRFSIRSIFEKFDRYGKGWIETSDV